MPSYESVADMSLRARRMSKALKRTLILVSLLPITAWANIHPIASLSLGVDSVNEHLNQNISITPPYQNSYNSSRHNIQPMGGVFLGVESPLSQDFSGQLGLSYYQSRAFYMNGSVYQFTDPTMDNLAYNYQLSSQRFLVETKILSTYRGYLHPYLNAGVGEAINQAYQYQEIGTDTTNVPMSQGFNNRTYQSFTYEVGFGLDVDLSKHFRCGAGYRFLDLGDAGLGPTPLQTGNQTIQYNHLHVNELLVQFSYIG